MSKATAAIVGPGNIGTDLLAKLQPAIRWRSGTWSVSTGSDGLDRAGRAVSRRRRGVTGCWTAPSSDWCSRPPRPGAPGQRTAVRGGGIQAIDLTPRRRAGWSPAGEPARAPGRAEPQHDHLRRAGDDPMVTRCPGPRLSPTRIVASIASVAGRHRHIDEFTTTTTRAIEQVAGPAR